MKAIFLNDIFTVLKQKTSLLSVLFFLSIGFLVGFKLNISIGDELAINAPYSVGFMTGLLSLTIILMATLIAFSILFKEADANFGLIVFSTPIKNKSYAWSRFFSFFILTLMSFIFLFAGYVIGLFTQTEKVLSSGFHLWHFLYPFLLFGIVNSFLVCSLLFFIAQKYQNKLLVAVSGLLLYILYMIMLMFSNAPFMAQSLPQSLFAQHISAIVDVFGLSSYFYESKYLTVFERSHEVVPFKGLLLVNRLLVLVLSLVITYLGVRSFSFLPVFKKKSKKENTPLKEDYIFTSFITSATLFNQKTKWKAILSFIKVDTIYVFKSIPMVAVSILLLFYIGVEMYDDINMGIRLPQQYASSGLLAQSIYGTFYFIGALVIAYFMNDLFWRSKATGFYIIQNTTYYSKEKQFGHFGSIALIIFYLTALLLLEAIAFQIIFGFPYIDWQAYFGVIVFITLPLVLFSLYLLFINALSTNKSIALGISMLSFLVLVTPISKSIFSNSIFHFFLGYKGVYSDFLGYGSYLPLFLWRLLFGLTLLVILFLLYCLIKTQKKRTTTLLGLVSCAIIIIVCSNNFLKGHKPKDKEIVILESINYEKKFRKYAHIPQPIIKQVNTIIDLFPEEQAYHIKGSYWIKNLHNHPIDSILLNLPKELEIKSLTFHYKTEKISIKKAVSEFYLKQALQPQDSAKLVFDLYYKWHAVNQHDPFNAIVKNGSFMRISRYFPQFGYISEKEVSDKYLREKHHLGEVTELTSLESDKVYIDDFTNINMQISTAKNQIAVGTGELKEEWQVNGRNYYRYTAKAIPFRFAISSAEYKVKRLEHKGISISVLYHPLHGNNVNHLIKNTQNTLDYCITNFGKYPFQSVLFAEVSSFTEGFAGTAYPGVIFMTENMTFNANIEGETNQDVVNELAGHEVAHFWWGCNQIDPDYREGYAVLTEGLAMYTEMMIYKKMYGKAKMMERLAIHQQIYDAEKGFSEHIPLVKATKAHPYLSYSKAAIVFVQLSEMIGEEKLNLALKHFLIKHKYPNAKPIATDLIREIINVSDEKHHQKIAVLFE